jgi:phosphatidylglycerophosphatase B
MPHEPNRTDPELTGPEQAPQPSVFLEVAVLASLAGAVLSVFLFAWIAEEMREGDIMRFDLAGRVWVHQFVSPRMTLVMEALSFIGSYVLVAAFIVSLIIFWKRRWRRGATWLTISMAGALVLDLTLKFAFHRQRPSPFFGVALHSWSFPSGHSLFSFCFYGVLGGLLIHRVKPLLWRIAIWCFAVALVAAIGISRIYLGVHYPSDVLAGYLAAAVWVTAMVALDRVRSARRVRKSAS